MPSRGPSQICLFLSGALGDFLLALPALQALRATYPLSQIDLVGNAGWLPLAQRSGAVNRCLPMDRVPVHAAFQAHLSENHPLRGFLAAYDLVISWFGDRENLWQETLSRACREAHVFPFHRHALFRGHVSDYFLDTLARTGHWVGADAQEPLSSGGVAWPGTPNHPQVGQLPLWPAGESWPGPVAAEAKDGCEPGFDPVGLTLHPGSGSPRKNWPKEDFLRVTIAVHERWGLPTLVLLGEAETDQQSFWKAAVGRYLSLGTGLTLAEVSGALRRTRVYLGNDSGVTHLSASLGVPTVALFGPTDPARWSPLGPRVRILSGAGADRSAATDSAPRLESLPEMERITPESVIEVLDEILSLYAGTTLR